MDIALTRVGSDRAELARRLDLATQIADRDGWRLDSICAQAHWVLKAGRDTLRAVLRVARWGNTLRPGAEQPTDLALEFTEKIAAAQGLTVPRERRGSSHDQAER